MRRLFSLLVLTAMVATPALAQQAPAIVAPTATPPPGVSQTTPAPPAQAPRAETPRAPSVVDIQGGIRPLPAHTNIRLDLTITDTLTGAPVKKTVSLIVLTNNSGMIRTVNYDRNASLNVDAIAAAYSSGLVSVRMTFEFSPPQPMKEGERSIARSPTLNESITVVLQDGKPMMVSQSADPANDRKVTAELTATILK